MNLKNFFRKRNPRDFKEAPAKDKSFRKYIVKAVSLIRGSSNGRENLIESEYDLDEIRRASEADSYIKTSFLKYSYMLFKAGYNFKAENEAAAEYIKLRMYIMSFSTGKPIDILFQEVGDDLIKYSNAFLIKSRVATVMPSIKAKGVYNNKVVGGYFRIDPSTISIDMDKFGTIKKYVQTIDGEEKEFKPSEVIHFYLDKEAANSFGTPRITAALEDVKALRKIEGNVLVMIHRFSMPLFQWIIGLPQQGFQATDREIEDTQAEIENMSLDGAIVTNEKTQIKVIGAEGSAIDVTNYLKYYEQRVFSALGVSESQMGRGGAKQDADSMESQAHDTVKHIQRVFSIFVENYMLSELLLEGGFDPINKSDDRVIMEFNEINLETKIKVENHEMAKYQSNMITFPEMRRAVGRKEEAKDKDLYKFKIEVKAEKDIAKVRGDESIRLAEETTKLSTESSIKIQKEAAKLQPKTETGGGNAPRGTSSKSSSSSSSSSKAKPSASKSKDSKPTSKGGNGISPKKNGDTKSQKPNKDVENKNTPSNQHGKTSVKVKEGASITNQKKLDSTKRYKEVYKIYHEIKSDFINGEKDYDHTVSVGIDSIVNSLRKEMSTIAFKGSDECLKDANRRGVSGNSVHIATEEIDDETRAKLKKLFKEIKNKIDLEDSKNIEAVFRGMEYRLRFILEYMMPQLYWLSYVITAKQLGYKKVYIDFDGSKDEEEHSKVVDLDNYSLDDIPPFHPFCNCEIYLMGDE